MSEANRPSPQKDTGYEGEKNEGLPVAIRVHRGLCIAEVLGSVRSHRVNSIKVYLTLCRATIIPHSSTTTREKSRSAGFRYS